MASQLEPHNVTTFPQIQPQGPFPRIHRHVYQLGVRVANLKLGGRIAETVFRENPSRSGYAIW